MQNSSFKFKKIIYGIGVFLLTAESAVTVSYAGATHDELMQEVPIYDTETGMFGVIKDQETAEQFVHDYGWIIISDDELNKQTLTPEHQAQVDKMASELSAGGAATENKTNADAAISDDKAETQEPVLSVDETQSDAEDAVTDDKTEAEAVSSNTGDVQESADADSVEESEPFSRYTDAAHDLLLSRLQSNDGASPSVNIYANSESIYISAEQIRQLFDCKEEFSINIVGPKNNELYRYIFSPESAEVPGDGVELKMSFGNVSDIETYLSFHKTQEMPEETTFVMYGQGRAADYELRTDDGTAVAAFESDGDGTVQVKLSETGNFRLVNTDLEKRENGEETAPAADKGGFRQYKLIAEAVGIAAFVVAAIVIFCRKKTRKGR